MDLLNSSYAVFFVFGMWSTLQKLKRKPCLDEKKIYTLFRESSDKIGTGCEMTGRRSGNPKTRKRKLAFCETKNLLRQQLSKCTWEHVHISFLSPPLPVAQSVAAISQKGSCCHLQVSRSNYRLADVNQSAHISLNSLAGCALMIVKAHISPLLLLLCTDFVWPGSEVHQTAASHLH